MPSQSREMPSIHVAIIMTSDVDPRLVSLFSGWHGPRTVLIPKADQGYGFTLRHFVVHPPESIHDQSTLDDPSQLPGTRSNRPRQGTQEPLETIFVKHVFEGGTAHAVGLTPGDRILAVNDIPTSGKSYAEVISIIQNCDGILKLQVLPEHEDILQMAYKGSSQSLSPNMYPMPYKPSTSINPIQSGATIRLKGQSQLRTATPDDSVYTGQAVLRRQWSASSDDSASEMDERGLMSERGRALKTSTSYTSGLSIYHDPRGRKNGSKSASDLSSVVHRRSRDKVLHPNDSQENISKALNSRSQTTTRVIPLDTRYPREKTPSKENLSSASSGYSTSSSRHSYPDSMSNITPVTVIPRSYTSQTNVSTDRAKSDKSARQYIPVLRSSPATHTTKVTASVDGLDSKPQTPSERNLEIFEHPNQGSGGRTFIVKIGDRHFEGGISQGHSPSQVSMNSSLQKPSYGTAFALTRSPVSGQFELSQEVPIVKHKKQMFEKGQNDNTHVGGNFNRYKTEIQKITSNGKFSSVQERLANFEKEGSPQKLRRMSSTERYTSPEPQCQPQYQRQMSPTNQQQAFSSSSNQTQAFQESAPIRIYVSQGTVSATASPLVEIVPVYQESPQPSVTTKSVMHVQDESDGACHSIMHEETPQRRSYHEGERSDDGHGPKPVRKPSFLAAVNAPHQRCK
ncbi:hypothetical protein FSP39_025208 [Pinctada imbricata]|uniref:PDZ domain-containing protein n=1 Tax=Pinctada imbricata TaxID=66713 RepID=A0AA89CE92_PINIB|nr:hypothetical protein FSP39_025208 [Pinctada imbricata]